MSFRSFLSKTFDDFRGAWPELDQVGGVPSRASLAQNVRFRPGEVYTRDGFGRKYAFGGSGIRSLYNWVTQAASRVVYLSGSNSVNMINLQTDVVDPLYTQACSGLSVAEAATRLYIAHFGTPGQLVGAVRVVNALIGGTPSDLAFPDPVTFVPTITDPASGTCTTGTKKFAYLIESRTGFPGRPSPINAGTFTPVSFTVPGGGRTVRFSITFTTVPSDAFALHILMTTAANTERYFYVPGASVSLPPGAVSWNVQVDINITDEQLTASGNEATDNFSYLTQNFGAPAATKVFGYGNRMVYLANNKAYVSDPYNYQVLAEDRNALQLQNQREIVTGLPVRGLLALFGPNWTYTIAGDNQRFPREWGAMTPISDQIGTPAPNGVAVSAGYQYGWVAAKQGLFYFDGQFSELPVSWLQDWKRINWGVSEKLSVFDNSKDRIVYVLAPIDGASEPNCLMTFDYSRARTGGGINPMLVDYSMDKYNGGASIYSMGLVEDYATKDRALWIGMPNGDMLRHEKGRRNDYAPSANVGVDSIYETGLSLEDGDQKGKRNRFAGMTAQVSGDGNLQVTPYGLNRVRQSDDSVAPISLSPSPAGEISRRWHLHSENQTVRFNTSQPGEWFSLAQLTVYYKPSGDVRP